MLHRSFTPYHLHDPQDLLWFHHPRPRWQPPPPEDGQTQHPEPNVPMTDAAAEGVVAALGAAPDTVQPSTGAVAFAEAAVHASTGPAGPTATATAAQPAAGPTPAAAMAPQGVPPAAVPAVTAAPVAAAATVPTTPLKLVELRTLTLRGVVEGWKQVAPSCSLAEIWAKARIALVLSSHYSNCPCANVACCEWP